MSELAFNYKGEPFAPPSEAAAWRVRRMREAQRGQLDVVRDSSGVPVIVPIGVGFDAFRAAIGGAPGRYRLDALDEHRLPVADCDAAYVTVEAQLRNAAAGAAAASVPLVEYDDAPTPAPVSRPRGPVSTTMVTAPFGTWPALPMPSDLSGSEYLLAEALRGQVMTIQMLTSALSDRSTSCAAGAREMIGAAAELVRAADGAAMPLRRPLPPPPALPPGAPPPPPFDPMPRNAMAIGADDGDADDELAAEPTEQDMFAKVLSIADKVQGVIAPVADVARLVMGGFGNDAALRNAGPVDEPVAAEVEAPATEPPIPSHLCTSHMLLIGYELGAEGSRFRRLVMHLEPDQRQRLTAHLCALPFEDAVAEAAALLARVTARHEAQDAAQREADASESTDDGGLSGDRDPDDADADGHDSTDVVDIVPTDGAPVAVITPAAAVATTAPAASAELAMVPTAQLEPVLQEQRQVTPPPGLSSAEAAARMKAITQHLKVTEILKVHSLLGATPQAERDAWSARLLAMPPAEAAALIRAELARRGG
ncbi:MAG: hypothetical protein IPL61_12610 [Myxococcales bacterium]|nr:hypothetical protein [Myxococcales bacterium]